MAKILLVDADEALRLMMGRQLRRAGYEVTLAKDGVEAAQLLEQERFDVVVADMKIPRRNGMELLAQATELALETEFIFLTDYAVIDHAIEALTTGDLFAYLLKPLNNIFELNTVVARALERRHLCAENRRLVQELEERVRELEAAKQKLTEMEEQCGLPAPSLPGAIRIARGERGRGEVWRKEALMHS